MGAVSSAAFTSGAVGNLLIGAIAGVLAVAIGRGRRIHPMHVANRTSMVALSLWAIPYFGIAIVNRVAPQVYGTLGTIVVVMTATAWLTGFLGITLAGRAFPQDWDSE